MLPVVDGEHNGKGGSAEILLCETVTDRSEWPGLARTRAQPDARSSQARDERGTALALSAILMTGPPVGQIVLDTAFVVIEATYRGAGQECQFT
jgi:hypothetical protein